MTTTAKRGSRMKSLEAGKSWHADPPSPVGKADVVGEETAISTSRATAVRVQASRERLAEITSGRAISQQGLAATCKDSPAGRQAEGGERDLVWRMSPYERRRRGNALRDGAGHRLGAGNTVAERRGSGHLAVPGHARAQNRDSMILEVGTSPRVNCQRKGCMWAST